MHVDTKCLSVVGAIALVVLTSNVFNVLPAVAAEMSH